jgi:hypothetical protein
MIEIEVLKIENDSWICANPNCLKLPQYINADDKWNSCHNHIKKDTTCALISISNITIAYCSDCIDQLYAEIKSKLDKKLWTFQ